MPVRFGRVTEIRTIIKDERLQLNRKMFAMRTILLACFVATAAAEFTWDSCGTRLDRLKTTKFVESGALAAGSKVPTQLDTLYCDQICPPHFYYVF